ncbi:MAG TPA: DUF131 domain-containing protein [Candidatus Bathyarchaeota archaeon]|nr:DUF131 domain-containing protein [Candidatus Bathyarchaeota archaeon]
MMDATFIFLMGFILIILGVLLSFIATVIMFFSRFRDRKAKVIRGGGLIMIGPIPIIFGTDKETMKILILLSITLMVMALIFILVLNWASLG